MKSQPFKRFNNLMSVISAAMAAIPECNGLERMVALAAMPKYRSRGKGKGLHQKARHGAHMDRVRQAKKQHNIAKRK